MRINNRTFHHHVANRVINCPKPFRQILELQMEVLLRFEYQRWLTHMQRLAMDIQASLSVVNICEHSSALTQMVRELWFSYWVIKPSFVELDSHRGFLLGARAN